MKDSDRLAILGVCEECFDRVGREVKKQIEDHKVENTFLLMLCDTMNISHDVLIAHGRGQETVIARSLHILFLRHYLHKVPASIMKRYGLNRTTYYNSIKLIEQLQLTRADREKFQNLFASYPKLLENHVIEYNKTKFFKLP